MIAIAQNALLTEKTLRIVSRLQHTVRARSDQPAQRSTTSCPLCQTATAPPRSCLVSKFSVNSSRTLRKRASQMPLINDWCLSAIRYVLVHHIGNTAYYGKLSSNRTTDFAVW